VFFLDEATSVRGGHRPCFYAAATTPIVFARRGAGQWRFSRLARDIDALCIVSGWMAARSVLHPLRGDEKLPDGAMVQVGATYFLILQGMALQWSMAGFARP